MYLQQFFIDGLGCASYLVGCEAHGLAAVIDPDRDVQKYLDAASARNLCIAYVIETHLHADHVSGNTDLAQLTGAEICLHEGAEATFEHRRLKDGDQLSLGNLRLDVLHTPGHTPESITLLLSDTTRGETPWLALTGDTLFVGDVGRPDLTGATASRQLAAMMHDSIEHKLLPLDDSLLIYPGHGSGSLCGKSIGSMRVTTLGYERRFNPALAPRQQAEFIEYATSELPEQPGNHQRIKVINRQGPKPLGDVRPRPLTIQQAITYFQRGAALLDVRSKEAFIEKHIPGSIHLKADEQFSNRIGFILPPEHPVVLLVENAEQYRQVVYSLGRVGYEQVLGHLAESLETWEGRGLPTASGDIQDITPNALYDLLQSANGNRLVVLDVREGWEYKMGHVPGAKSIPLGELHHRVGELDPETPVAVICASGHRSQSAAALLGQKNFKKVYNVLSGTGGWAQRGLPIER